MHTTGVYCAHRFITHIEKHNIPINTFTEMHINTYTTHKQTHNTQIHNIHRDTQHKDTH